MNSVRPQGSGARSWPKCTTLGCYGNVAEKGKCLAHIAVGTFDSYFDRIKYEKDAVYFCGVQFNDELMQLVIHHLAKKRHFDRLISFEGCEINAEIRLSEFRFEQTALFNGATFYKPVEFDRCIFEKGIQAQYVQLHGPALDIRNSEIKGAHFDASYSSCDLNGIRIEGSRFEKDVIAEGNFLKAFRLENSTVSGSLIASNSNTVFLFLSNSEVQGEFRADNAKFSVFHAQGFRCESANHVGPFEVENDCVLSRTKFSSRLTLDVGARALNLENSQFLSGGYIFADKAEINLRQFVAGKSVQISGRAGSATLPKVVELRGADAGAITFSNVDLSDCVFYGANNLSGIKIEPTVKFSKAPWWRGSRKYIADEKLWLDPLEVNRRVTVGLDSPRLKASQVATSYRELRRGFEQNADEPGSSVFYYGEMEMRRRDKTTSLFQRLIITGYWLVSGYGLKVGRPFIALAILFALSSFLIAKWGFETGPRTFLDGAAFSLKAIVSLLPGQRSLPPTGFTNLGKVVEVSFVVLSTLCLAFLALAVRNQVKRR